MSHRKLKYCRGNGVPTSSANGLEPAPVADLRFILHEYAAHIGHPGLRYRRLYPEFACAQGAAEYAPLRTIYFGWELSDAGTGAGFCGSRERLLHRIATMAAIILRARSGIEV